MKVHSADGALMGTVGVVDLGYPYIKSGIGQFQIAKHPRKMPACITGFVFIYSHYPV